MTEPITVKKHNENQDLAYAKFVEKCKKNGVEILPQNRYFPRIDMKQGFVMDGKYPIYKKRKMDFNF